MIIENAILIELTDDEKGLIISQGVGGDQLYLAISGQQKAELYTDTYNPGDEVELEIKMKSVYHSGSKKQYTIATLVEIL